MRWSKDGRSTNLEDRRGASGGGGGGGFGRMGLGGIAIVVVLALLTKQNPLALLQQVEGGSSIEGPVAPVNDASEEQEVRFISFVLDTTQATWRQMIDPSTWRDAKLVIFRDQVASACGNASAASGPFYCPGDEKVYIDLGFYDELASRFGAPGEFAQAYVLAHEIGHHVQGVLGLEEAMRQAQRRQPDQVNQLSINFELQADCLAGVWGYAAAKEGILQTGDLEAGLAAAASVGDDRIQRMGGGSVQPESWTHGSSAQRVQSFRRGFESGSPNACGIR